MRILVFSDTHSDISHCIRVIENIISVDMIIHAGDHAKDAELIQKAFPDIEVKYVRGNCDLSTAPAELTIDVCSHRIFVTHGHLYNVKYESDYKTLINHAKSLGADVAVFGHTHIPHNENFGNFCILNPGSSKYGKTFGVIEVENGRIKTAVC